MSSLPSSDVNSEKSSFATINRTIDYSVTQTYLVRISDDEGLNEEELEDRVSRFVEGGQTPQLSADLGVAQIDDTMSQIENSESFDVAEPSDGNVKVSRDCERLILRDKSEMLHDALTRLIKSPGEASSRFATDLLDSIAAETASNRDMLEGVLSSVDRDGQTPVIERG